jgi:REP element-mobilizing transposase RayT
MTAPRQVLPGTTYLVTRRCAKRQFLLRPSKVTNQVFLYLLALAAQRYRVEVHAYCVMSNHYHLVVTDPDARLPLFLQYIDGLVGRAINALLGLSEAFWGSDSYSAVSLAGPQDVVDKTAYTLANPVAAGLVRSGLRWPGLRSTPDRVGAAAWLVERPNYFFDPKGDLPESVAFELTAPPGFATAELFREQVGVALAAREAEAGRRAPGFLGLARVLKQKVTARPRSAEPRRQLNPRVASRDKWKRIEALGRLVSFLSKYRNALREWRQGNKDVLFPAGTYEMRVSYGAVCAGAG